MRRHATAAPLLLLALSGGATAQSATDHVWSVNELRAHPGQETAYTEAIQRYDLPVMEEVIRQGGAVSQTLLIKQAGNMENGTHLLIIEYASWDDYINADNALDQAARSLFGRSYPQLAAEEYMPLRDVIRREVYVAPPSGM